jgi:hypothetical protein
MPKSIWTERRLERLFARYNHRFWQGRLTTARISITKLDDCQGKWDPRQREIRIDIDTHTSDRCVRSTLLHEMCHQAAPGGGHGSKFWVQLERLLRQKAPITVGFPEASHLGPLREDVVPKRFPLARRKMDRAAREAQRERDKFFREYEATHGKVDVINMEDQDIIAEFGDNQRAAFVPWLTILCDIGTQYGLLNVDGKPKNKWASRIIEEGQKAHRRVRREHLESERFQKLVDKSGTQTLDLVEEEAPPTETLTSSERQYVEKVKRKVSLRSLRAKACWRNAQLLMLHDDENRLRYWECGYDGRGIPHA